MKYSNTITAVLTTLLLSACSGGGGSNGFELNFGDCPFFGGAKIFSFSPVSSAALDTLTVSNEVKIECDSNLDIRISGGTYSIDGNAFTSAQGKIGNGQRLRVQVRSASTFGTTSSAGVLVGDWVPGNILFNTLVSASFQVTTVPGDPANAPTATILSPQDNATVNASRITVSGQASDPDGISEIRVNGELATSNDGFLTWAADVPLVFGSNTITVSTADTFLNINPTAHIITIENLAVGLAAPVDIAVDDARSRILVLDSQLRALIEINLITNEHTVISDDLTPNDLTPFANPQRIAVSALGDKAWIIDRGYEDLIVVDLATGSRSLLVDTTSTDVSESLVDARDIALDEISSNALILAGGSDGINDFETRVISIDLADGARFVLSDGLTPNADNPLEDNPFEMSVVFDSVGFRLLVMQRGDLLSVDPLTGHRSVFSDTGVGGAVDATHDALNNRVLVVNRVNSTLYGANLNSGDVQSIWPLNFGGSPTRIAFDPLNNRTLVLYKFRNEIFATDMVTGESSIVY